MSYARGGMRNPPLVAFAILCAAAAVAQEPQPTPLATGRLTVQGRLVDAQGQPLARCDVKLTAHESTGYAMSWNRTDWVNPEPIRTGDAGRFRFDLQLPAPSEALDRGRFHLNVSHPRRVSWYSHCAFVVAQRNGGVDYGDVVLPEGHYPRLRVEDERGALQPGVLIRLRPEDASSHDPRTPIDGPHSWLTNYGYRRTDIDGYLHLRSPIAAGTYRVQVPDRDVPQDLAPLEVPSKDAYTIVVRRIPRDRTIAGRVVDDQGAPVSGARLRGGQGSTCYSRRDGRFTLVAKRGVEAVGMTQLSVAHNGRYDGWHEIEAIAWGTPDAEIEVPATALRTFVVLDAEGEPVERFNLYCHPLERQAGRSPVRLSGTFEDGQATARLAPGTWQVLVSPLDGRNVVSPWREVEVAGEERIELRLPAPVLRTVTVRAADGTPVRGALVEVIEGGAVGGFDWLRPATQTRPPNPNVRSHTPLIASARTDAQGRASLRLASAGRCRLRISGKGVRRAVHKADLTPDRLLELEAAAGAALSASITPIKALQKLDPSFEPDATPTIYSYHSRSAPRVRLVCGAGAKQLVVEGVLLDQAGRFQCDGLPPGRVEVHLSTYPKRDRSWLLGTFELKAGAAQKLELKLPADAIRNR